MAISVVSSGRAARGTERLPRHEVDVGSPGHSEQIAWAMVPGATDVEISSAKATIGSAQVTAVRELAVSVASDGQSRDVVVPSGARVISLGLTSLKWVHTVQNEGEDPKDASDHLDSVGALNGANVRLVVSTPDARNQMSPVYAIPQVGRQGALPPQFGGASYSSSSLSVYGLKGPKLRVMLTEDQGKKPQDWTAARTECGALSAMLGWFPTSLELKGSDGATLWAFPHEMTDDIPDAEVDLAAPLRAVLVTALKAKKPLEHSVTLRANAPSKAHFTLRIDGAVVRAYPKDAGTLLEGEARPFQLDGEALGGEVPSSVTADIAILYAGIRILDEVNDVVPVAGGASGLILTESAAYRSLPRPFLKQFPVVRVGIIGRAPETCELSLQLVEMRGEAPGAPYGDPGTLTIDPSDALAIHWIEIPEHRPLGPAVALALRATSGRFFWVREDRFLARVAVADPNPAGRAVTLGGKPFALADKGDSASSRKGPVTPDEKRYEWKGASLPTGAFAAEAPLLSSLLFVTVNVRDLTLRYARQVRA